MKKDDHFFKELYASIETELTHIERLRSEMKAELAGETPPNPRVLGSILHDFYNCCERIFKRTASEINGGYYQADKWHKELLFRMTLAVEDLRPELISEELAAELDEYLAFRHVFRNIYGFELKSGRLTELTKKFDRVAGRYNEEIRLFLKLFSGS